MYTFVKLTVMQSLEDESNSTEVPITASYEIEFDRLEDAITDMHKAIELLQRMSNQRSREVKNNV